MREKVREKHAKGYNSDLSMHIVIIVAAALTLLLLIYGLLRWKGSGKRITSPDDTDNDIDNWKPI